MILLTWLGFGTLYIAYEINRVKKDVSLNHIYIDFCPMNSIVSMCYRIYFVK